MFNKLITYDTYERHKAVDLLIGNHNQFILDAGVAGYLSRFLTSSTVIALNVDNTGDNMYSGKFFPFAPGVFDAVISLDTLEHIPRHHRADFLQECIRVSKGDLLIAAPYGSKLHSIYEAKLDNRYKEISGEYNKWLHEHILYGLPTDDDIQHMGNILTGQGYSVRVLYSGDFVWQCRSLERLLLMEKYLEKLWQLGALINSILTMALWQRVRFSADPYKRANRFYLLGTAPHLIHES